MKTRAVVSVEHGKPLVIEDLDLPDPGPTDLAHGKIAGRAIVAL